MSHRLDWRNRPGQGWTATKSNRGSRSCDTEPCTTSSGHSERCQNPLCANRVRAIGEWLAQDREAIVLWEVGE